MESQGRQRHSAPTPRPQAQALPGLAKASSRWKTGGAISARWVGLEYDDVAQPAVVAGKGVFQGAEAPPVRHLGKADPLLPQVRIAVDRHRHAGETGVRREEPRHGQLLFQVE